MENRECEKTCRNKDTDIEEVLTKKLSTQNKSPDLLLWIILAGTHGKPVRFKYMLLSIQVMKLQDWSSRVLAFHHWPFQNELL